MEKINKLKKIFKQEEIDGYIIPKNDEFFGEYTPEHNDRLNFISGFTGSFGFALVLKNKNYLFVDGRYTLQANNQSGRLFKIITIPNKMPSDIFKGKKLSIGFDPNLFTQKTYALEGLPKLGVQISNVAKRVGTTALSFGAGDFIAGGPYNTIAEMFDDPLLSSKRVGKDKLKP